MAKAPTTEQDSDDGLPTCFVIGPIGDEDSDTRVNADWLLHSVIGPAVGDTFRVERADHIATPGSITSQVISMVLEADLVIADLAEDNPNAYYELGLRHMAEKPVIHLYPQGAKLPFDVKDYRSVAYSTRTVGDVERARRELVKHVAAVRSLDYTVSNPVTHARGYQKLAQSTDSQQRMIAQLLTTIERLETRLVTVEEKASADSESQRLRNSGLRGLLSAFNEDSPGGKGASWKGTHGLLSSAAARNGDNEKE